jgi:PAS domain S-box-containing protein
LSDGTPLSARLEAILLAIPDIVAEVNADKTYTWMNQAGLDFFGDDAVGRDAASYFVGEQDTYQTIEPLFQGKEGVFYLESLQRRQDGEARLLAWWCRRLTDDSGEITGALSTARDISEASVARTALIESEERYRRLAESAHDMIWRTDLKGTVEYVNPACRSFLGISQEQTIGLPVADYLSPEAVSSITTWIRATIRSGETHDHLRQEVEYLHKDGHRVPAEINVSLLWDADGRVVSFEGVSRDITERRRNEAQTERLRAQLLQAQKMEALGTMASGVAHEINNPINIVSNYAELILDDVKEDSEIAENVDGILKASARIATIVKSLLTFARQDQEQKKPAHASEIVASVVLLVRKVLERDGVTLEVAVPDDLPLIHCHSQQIQQVLMNLIANARDALNARYPSYHIDKVLRLRAAVIDNALDNDGSSWVRITVENQGEHIPEGVIGRIFDPFFTTKPREKGTGLGLSVNHGIVLAHGGLLTAESEASGWTRFHVDLRLTEEQPTTAGSAATDKGKDT